MRALCGVGAFVAVLIAADGAWANYPYPQCAEDASIPMGVLVEGARHAQGCQQEIAQEGMPSAVCRRFRELKPRYDAAVGCRLAAVYFYDEAAQRFPSYKPPVDQAALMKNGALASKAIVELEGFVSRKWPGYWDDDSEY